MIGALNLSNVWSFLNDKYVAGFMALFLAVYAGLAGPKLSPDMISVLESDVFRMVAVFLIAYLPEKNFQFALVLSVVLVLSLNYVNEHKLLENFLNKY